MVTSFLSAGAWGRERGCAFPLLGSDGEPGSAGSRAILSCAFLGCVRAGREPSRRRLVPGLRSADARRAVASHVQAFLCSLWHVTPRGGASAPGPVLEPGGVGGRTHGAFGRSFVSQTLRCVKFSEAVCQAGTVAAVWQMG